MYAVVVTRPDAVKVKVRPHIQKAEWALDDRDRMRRDYWAAIKHSGYSIDAVDDEDNVIEREVVA